MNLLRETLEILSANGKGPRDVLWVGTTHTYGYRDARRPRSYSWDQFAAVADFDYDNGYGGNEIASSLKVVGTDWWLERGEYDGSEWWEFKTLPTKPEPVAEVEKADLLDD